MNNNYNKAYTEVLEILSHFPKDEYSKIPKEKIDFYKENMDRDYIYHINPKIELSKQYISKEANAILVSLFRDYFATESQKETLKKLLDQNQNQLENEKRDRYKTDNIFKKENSNIAENNTKNDEIQLVEYKESFFRKFIKFITRSN